MIAVLAAVAMGGDPSIVAVPIGPGARQRLRDGDRAVGALEELGPAAGLLGEAVVEIEAEGLGQGLGPAGERHVVGDQQQGAAGDRAGAGECRARLRAGASQAPTGRSCLD